MYGCNDLQGVDQCNGSAPYGQGITSASFSVTNSTLGQDLQSVLSILNPPRLTVTDDEARPPRAGEVSHPIPGLALIDLPGGDDNPVAEARILFSALDAIEQRLGPGIAAPDHMMSVTPATD